MTGIVVRNLSEQLVVLLRDRILAGRIDADRAIRQDALAAELGVSKIPLREALTRLEQEGLVRLHANRGYFVRELTMDEAEEVYALRLKLEPEVAGVAAMRATDAERDLAIRTLAQLDEVTNAHGDGVGAFNRAFHLALLRPSRQTITTTMLERLHVLGERYVRRHLEPLGRDQRANDEHAQLLQCWLARDASAVAARMYAHIEQTVLDLRREFGNDGGDGVA
ncbi:MULTISPECIES: GntR family transcriptional regulator [Sphingomonas]|uniref:GntR family transcriptional regulator n=1 Tax=Sphingomonas hankookensis TaxID=563996 RepID=A0ABR5YB03_9SPHN|nr:MULTISPECIES: GntR family transcriptional regulator [Sphingomonas]KZE12130.1 GntR family transcriptional regulator [Sphingomonas hankookensis]PZT91487.1 MAG: GntR family transcriptional regulator [Sphingomonas sp.]RSV21145.1 GntR family transcriptional regulator [Sphingomonas sp. ABOLH]WCP74032.1 GntR family transcriptional regulator [Sphingomonas hankookensis]